MSTAPSDCEPLTQEEMDAIRHAKVFVANTLQIKQLPSGEYVPLDDNAAKADPAIPGRIKTLNTLESLCNSFS